MTDKEVDEIYNSRYNYLYKLLQKRERELAKEHPMCGTLYKFTYSEIITILADSERDASRILHIISPYSYVFEVEAIKSREV